ncbi:MAG: site-specific DNA-methyltransferase [Vicinamibacterales bacterium]
MSMQFEKLVTLLKELFQLDQPDLDFGLYRIMHAKAGEITQFLEKDLLPQVQDAFSRYTSADKAVLETELKKAIEQANGLGVDPETTAKVKGLRQKIATESVDVAALEAEVYDHLYSFFRRYYDEGDFLAKRVYKAGVYAIPYEGEEVKLHWANRDQYYIKTSEFLRDYAFTLRPSAANDPMRVHFRLADAAEGEHGNVKAAEGKDRVFILAAGDFIAVEDGELVLRFQYRPAGMEDWPAEARAAATAAAAKKPPVQKELSADAVRRVLAVADPALKPWIDELSKKHVKANAETADYSRLEGHLNRYVARHTFDYFIHKDLGGFLRRELDFFIKNEIMHLDDVESESAPRVEQYISKIKVVRGIAHKLIAFLAQLEDFQKKLWLKKKFVVETCYCITLNRIPEEFYPEIAANDAQREEWVQLIAIDSVAQDLMTRPYSSPLTTAFLKDNPTLIVDTRHFPQAFVARLLDTLADLDEKTTVLVVHGENTQALHTLHARYAVGIDCVYIDPPYNTGNDGFLYKDSYQHSTWLSMFDQAFRMGRPLVGHASSFFVSCDDNEMNRLRQYLDTAFGPENLESQIVVQSNKRGQTYRSIAKTHEYLLAYDVDDATQLNGLPKDLEGGDSDQYGNYELWELRNRNPKFGRFNRPNLYFPVFVSPAQLQRLGYSTVSVTQTDDYVDAVYPRNSEGQDSCWRWSVPKVEANSRMGDRVLTAKKTRQGDWRIFEKSRKALKAAKSIWADSDVISEKGTVEVGALGLREFGFPKPLGLIEKVFKIGMSDGGTALDYFAGSGTTAHAIVNLNRDDEGRRKAILVEMGDHVDSVLLPRIKKVTFTPEWDSGRPRRRPTVEEAQHGPGIIKLTRLESYEDALNNLDTRRSAAQASLLDAADAAGADGLKEEYLLRYMLNVETRGSQSLLNVSAFSDPTAYRLKVKAPGSDAGREVNVDLLETFNYLIGMTVRHIAVPQTFQALFKRDAEGRLVLDGRLKQDEAGPWWFRTVDGTTPDGRKALVIWRKLTGDAEQDNLVLDAWITVQGYSTKDYEFDLIFVNGDNNLENLRQGDETWKVRLIEEDFHRLMFDVESV